MSDRPRRNTQPADKYVPEDFRSSQSSGRRKSKKKEQSRQSEQTYDKGDDKVCKFTERGQQCPYGSKCWYSHTHDQGTSYDQGTYYDDGSSYDEGEPDDQRKIQNLKRQAKNYFKNYPKQDPSKINCKWFESPGGCYKGSRCPYMHVSHEQPQYERYDPYAFRDSFYMNYPERASHSRSLYNSGEKRWAPDGWCYTYPDWLDAGYDHEDWFISEICQGSRRGYGMKKHKQRKTRHCRTRRCRQKRRRARATRGRKK